MRHKPAHRHCHACGATGREGTAHGRGTLCDACGAAVPPLPPADEGGRSAAQVAVLSGRECAAWESRGITIRNGIWPPHIREGKSSSWKEFATIRDSIRDTGKNSPNRLSGHHLFHFTDNLNSVEAWAKGTSPSPELLGIIQDIQKEEAVQDFDLVLVHAAGEFLVFVGVDGCSRGYAESYLRADSDGFGPRVPIHRAQSVPPEILTFASDRLGIDTSAPLPLRQWEPTIWVGKRTLMLPHASIARQCIFDFLRAYGLHPHATGGTIIMPFVRPNNYGSLLKYFELVQIFPQGTNGVHASAAHPWLLLHKTPAPVPWRYGYRCDKLVGSLPPPGAHGCGTAILGPLA
jgi:hypothetical protein